MIRVKLPELNLQSLCHVQVPLQAQPHGCYGPMVLISELNTRWSHESWIYTSVVGALRGTRLSI